MDNILNSLALFLQPCLPIQDAVLLHYTVLHFLVLKCKGVLLN